MDPDDPQESLCRWFIPGDMGRALLLPTEPLAEQQCAVPPSPQRPSSRGLGASILELWSLGAQDVLREVSGSALRHAKLHPTSTVNKEKQWTLE